MPRHRQTPNQRRHFVAWCLGVGTVLVMAGTAHAVIPTTTGLTVTPGELNFSLSKDAPSQTIPVSITNHYKVDIELNAQFKGIDEAQGHLVPAGAVEANLAPALASSVSDFVVPAGQTQTIQIKFSNLASLSPGGHYATLLLTQQGSNSGKLNLRAAVSLNIFAVKVQGEHQQLQLSSFKTNGWLFHLPSSMTLRFKNTGNVLVVPRAAVVVQRYGNIDPLAKGIANANSLPLLPDKQLTSVTPLQRLQHIFWPAHLQILVAYRYDGGAQPGIVTRRMWYVPPLWPILFIIVIVALIQRRKLKRFVRAKTATMSAAPTSSQIVESTVVEPSRQNISVDHKAASQEVEVVVPTKVKADDLAIIKSPKPRKKATKKPAAKKSNSAKTAAKRQTVAKKSTPVKPAAKRKASASPKKPKSHA